jgi:hypothetical protein
MNQRFVRQISGNRVEVFVKKPKQKPQSPATSKKSRQPRFEREDMRGFVYQLVPLGFLSIQDLDPVDKIVMIAGSGLRFLQQDPVPRDAAEGIQEHTGLARETVEAALEKLVVLDLVQNRGGGAYRFRPMAEWLERRGIEGPMLSAPDAHVLKGDKTSGQM